jgi:hypothetical protein
LSTACGAYEPELNPVYAAALAHHGVVADPARVRDPDRKGTHRRLCGASRRLPEVFRKRTFADSVSGRSTQGATTRASLH